MQVVHRAEEGKRGDVTVAQEENEGISGYVACLDAAARRMDDGRSDVAAVAAACRQIWLRIESKKLRAAGFRGPEHGKRVKQFRESFEFFWSVLFSLNTTLYNTFVCY